MLDALMDNQQSLTLEIEGQYYDAFTSGTCSTQVEACSGTFSFEISSPESLDKFPISINSKCRVLAGDMPILTGYVEEININYNVNGHTIEISGRDKTCDVIDSTLGNNITFTAPITLEAIAEKVLSILGIEDIVVITNTDIEPFKAGEIFSSEVGESAFDFLEKYAKKRQVLITTDGYGNLVFARSGKERLKTTLDSSYYAQANILSGRVSIDQRKLFYKYIFSSQVNTSAEAPKQSKVIHLNDIKTGLGEGDEDSGEGEEQEASISPEQVTFVSGTAYDTNPSGDLPVRKTRIYNYTQSETSCNDNLTATQRAQWEANVRRARAKKYTYTVQGFNPINDDGLAWKPNMLVNVTDNYLNLDSSDLLISEVNFSYSLDGGSITTLTLVDKDSFYDLAMSGVKYKKKKAAQKQSPGLVKTIHLSDIGKG